MERWFMRLLHLSGSSFWRTFQNPSPEIHIKGHQSDAMVDLIGEGFDAAIRIAILPDSSLVARRLCEVVPYLVGSPAYLNKHGRPQHPADLAAHRCIEYSYTMRPETWHFTKDGRSTTVRPSGPLRVNNGDAMLPALIAGTGVGILSEFFLRDALAAGRLERLLPAWSLPAGAVYWVTPPGGPRPKRVEVLGDFLVEKLARRTRPRTPTSSTSMPASAGKTKRPTKLRRSRIYP
jgi:DNA-binding transcriptional LysR family regulator